MACCLWLRFRSERMIAMSKVKLKPCPFCGKIPNLYGQEVRDYVNGEWTEMSRKEYWVQTQCSITCLMGIARAKAYGVIGGTRYTSENAAIKAWNTRYSRNTSQINENAAQAKKIQEFDKLHSETKERISSDFQQFREVRK